MNRPPADRFAPKFNRVGHQGLFSSVRIGSALLQSNFRSLVTDISRVLHPPRRSLELRILVDRQYPMKNIAVDHSITLQVDAGGMDSSL